MLQPPRFYFVKKTKRFVILSSDKSSERNLSSFFDIKNPESWSIYRVKNPSPQIRILLLLGSYWSYYMYCLIFFLTESIISTGRFSIKIHCTGVLLLLYYSSYNTYWFKNFPSFTNIGKYWLI